MPKKIQCYLAGSFIPFGGCEDWRDYVESNCLCGKISFYDPRSDTEQESIASFTSQDLKGVGSSDVIFCFMDKNAGEVGSAAECGFGLAKNRMVILCIGEDVDFPHPFMLGLARRVIIGLDAGIEYLKGLADYGIENEFAVAYDFLKDKSQK